MDLSLARWRVELRVQPRELAETLAVRYAAFTCPGGLEPDLVVEVENQVPPAGEYGDTASILGAGLSTKDGEEYLLDGPAFYGMMASRRGFATLRVRSDEPEREIEYFLRIALALFSFQRDGLLLHSAGLMRSEDVSAGASGANDCAERVHLFVGQSGSGKSTVVSLSQVAGRATALGDDLILLRREPSGWHAYGTPFWNSGARRREAETCSGPIGRIYKLVQDREVFEERMGTAAAVAELAANCPIVNDQPALLPALIDRCRDLANATGVRRLHFRKDDSFWDVISREAPC